MNTQDKEKHNAACRAKLRLLEKKIWLPVGFTALVSETCALHEHARPLPASVLAQLELCSAPLHAQGKPLLPREAFPFDVAEARQLFAALLACALQHPETAAAAKQVQTLLDTASDPEETTVEGFFRALLAEHLAPFESFAAACPQAPRFLLFLTYNSLLPWLEQVGDALLARFPVHDVWPHGHCPVCGSPVFFGHLAKADPSRHVGNEIDRGGQRLHTCSFCRATFRAKRLQCPFCLEEHADKLGYFSVDTEPGIQVQVCRSCTSYVKIADFRDHIDSSVVPALDDLASLPLDFAAQEQGFERLSFSAWGVF